MQSLVLNPVGSGSKVSGSGLDPDPAGSSNSGSGLDPDPAGSKNSESGAPLQLALSYDIPTCSVKNQLKWCFLSF